MSLLVFGIIIAANQGSASLLPPMRDRSEHEEARKFMVNLKRKLLALAMLVCIGCSGAFAQKDKDQDRRSPPKDNNRVVVKPKEKDKPPPNNNQGDKNRGDKKGRP